MRLNFFFSFQASRKSTSSYPTLANHTLVEDLEDYRIYCECHKKKARVDKRKLKEKTTFSSGRPNSDFQGPAPGPGPEVAQGGRSSLQFCNSEKWPSLAHESSGLETHQCQKETIKWRSPLRVYHEGRTWRKTKRRVRREWRKSMWRVHHKGWTAMSQRPINITGRRNQDAESDETSSKK